MAGGIKKGDDLDLIQEITPPDNWKHRSQKMSCATCMYFVPKVPVSGTDANLGRCRRRAPTMNGWPVMFQADWCGDHKLDETKV